MCVTNRFTKLLRFQMFQYVRSLNRFYFSTRPMNNIHLKMHSTTKYIAPSYCKAINSNSELLWNSIRPLKYNFFIECLPLIHRGAHSYSPSILFNLKGNLTHFETSTRSCKKSTGPETEAYYEAGVAKKNSNQNILSDLEETKAKMKVKVDEIIERENIWTIPNLLCISRIVISPYICYCVLSSHYALGLGLFVVAGFTDLMDGMIARTFPSQASRIGSFLDPLADKILIASLFLTLTYAGLIPLLLTCTIVYRDIVIIGGASYVRYKSLPPPLTVSRYFDATHATAQLAPTLISKINTAIQLGLITASLAAPVFNFTDHYLLHTLWFITAVTTVSSGMSYIFSQNTYEILKKDKSGSSKK